MVSSIEKRLQKAEALCLLEGGRFTPTRKALLSLIYSYHEPLSAYDLLRLLRENSPKAEAVTVYRALDFLLKHHLIHRISSLNVYAACDMPKHRHRTQLLVCESCGNVQEIETSDLEKTFREIAKSYQFEISTKPLEINGKCKNCRHLPIRT